MSRKLIVSLVLLVAVMAVLIFGAAGTLDYWQAWFFLSSYLLASIAVSAWLVKHDPALLERRMSGGPLAEGEPTQKLIMALTSLGFIGLLVVPALDRRFGWSEMAPAVTALGAVLLFGGWYGIFRVFRANSFAAATVNVFEGQKVVATGPYAIVRHPMYAAALWLLLGIPLTLGSWWGALVLVVIVPALGWRLMDEERVLLRDLAGYAEYRRKVRWRLLPLVW